jgi:hypothetical protein
MCGCFARRRALALATSLYAIHSHYLLSLGYELLSSLTFPAAASAECAHRIMQNDTMDGAHPSMLIARKALEMLYVCVCAYIAHTAL